MTDEHITIFRADLRHLDLLTPLLDAYRQFYSQDADADSARKFLQARISGNECTIFLATDANENAEGFVLLYPTWDSVDLATYWVLHDLFVAPESRNRGVGKALMEKAARFGRSVGASRLDLGTQVTNSTAQHLYESLGWQRDSEFYSYSLSLDHD